MKATTFEEILIQEQLDEFDRIGTDGDTGVWADENDVDEFGQAFGLTYEMNEELQLVEKEAGRDRHRWELDPASADDWSDRRFFGRPSLPWRHFMIR